MPRVLAGRAASLITLPIETHRNKITYNLSFKLECIRESQQRHKSEWPITVIGFINMDHSFPSNGLFVSDTCYSYLSEQEVILNKTLCCQELKVLYVEWINAIHYLTISLLICNVVYFINHTLNKHVLYFICFIYLSLY